MIPKFFLSVCFLIIIHVVAAKKNILMLVSDDMRPNLEVYSQSNIPLYRYPPMHTPNLDALAKESMMFLNAYVQEALCGPSRASLLTGRRPDTTKSTQIAAYWRDMGGNFTTIPQFFKEHGYRAVGGGKVFHGGLSSNNNDPISWSDPYHEADDPYPDDKSSVWKAFSREQLDIAELQDTQEASYIVEKLKELAPAAKDGSTPFFLAIGVHRPHMPLYFPEEFLEYYPEDIIEMPYNPDCPIDMPEIAWVIPESMKYDDCKAEILGVPNLGKINVSFPEWKTKEIRRAYYSALSFADHELGRVLTELKNQELEDDTIVVFWSDHGWQLGEHAEWSKHTVFDIANRVPFLIKIPGITDSKGLQTSKLVEMVDIFPTLVEAAGFDPLELCPPDSHDVLVCTEGSSLLPLFDNPETESWKDAVFWQYPRGEFTDEKLPTKMGYSMKTDRYRYTEWVNIKLLGDLEYEPDWQNPADHEELYDLEIDPQENMNRYNDPDYVEIKSELSEKLRGGWRRVREQTRSL